MANRPVRPWIAVAALLGSAAFFILLLNLSAAASSQPQQFQSNPAGSSSYGLRPFLSTWTSWYNPLAWKETGTAALNAGFISKEWNILYHLGGNGPWIQKTDDVVTNDISAPEGCVVDQVHMISRHGERYPTVSSGARMLEVVEKLNASSRSLQLKKEFAFLDHWKFFVDDPDNELEQLTKSGPYSGSLEMFGTGVKFRTRYRHLIPKKKVLKVWASGSERVEETARYFSLGMFGLPLDRFARIEVIPETSDRGANTLTPSDGCPRYKEDVDSGHDAGDVKLQTFQSHYIPPILERLNKALSPSSQLTIANVYSMQEICGFETTARGKSPWCDIFTKDEWESFEYARDLYHYYRSGPGNKYSKVLGSTWINATSRLLEQGPSAGPFFMSFSHDSDMIPNFGMLGLLHDEKALPADKVVKDRKWKTSQVVPMGGRLVLESLSCKAKSKGKLERFVRVNINDGIVSIPGCTNGPGRSCPMDKFQELVGRKLTEAGDFKKQCGLPADSADGIDFFHQDL